MRIARRRNVTRLKDAVLAHKAIDLAMRLVDARGDLLAQRNIVEPDHDRQARNSVRHSARQWSG